MSMSTFLNLTVNKQTTDKMQNRFPFMAEYSVLIKDTLNEVGFILINGIFLQVMSLTNRL